MVVDASLSLSIRDEVVKTACDTQNRSIIVKHHGNTFYEQLKGRKHVISYFHIFGCVCFMLNQKDQLSKFQAKADERIFLGYSSYLRLSRCLI